MTLKENMVPGKEEAVVKERLVQHSQSINFRKLFDPR
jgi:hypothetical protein